MKISIIGHCGSGKSTLARQLATDLALPRLELDRLFFTHGGANLQRTDEAARERNKAAVVADTKEFLATNDSWVTDGIYRQTQELIAPQADQIIYLDIPLRRRQWNHLTRVIRREHRHAELSIWQDLYFTYDMIRRTRKQQPFLDELQHTYANKLVTLYVKNNRVVPTNATIRMAKLVC